uniref:Ribosomal protein S11 n=1 Tax=Strigamia maritima TaxID=126957 RepID=T1J6Q2_STRMM
MYPDENTPNLMFNGIRFAELPICHIKATKNNTLMTLTDRLGFKNTRKGTNIAAQTTGITIGKKALVKGITDVRVKVRGLGPGRMTSVRGLAMAGVNVVSLTDDTPVPFGAFPRPRKQRKL